MTADERAQEISCLLDDRIRLDDECIQLQKDYIKLQQDHLEVVKRGQENAGELQGQVFFASGASGVAREPGNEAVKKRRKRNRGKTVKEGERAEERKLEDAVKGKRCPDDKFPCFWHHTPEGCRRGTNCHFSHTSDLSDAEKAAISRLTARRAQKEVTAQGVERKGKM